MVIIARAAMSLEFPCAFRLVCAMNPCPRGYLGHTGGRCACSQQTVSRYRSRISGPLLDRIDRGFRSGLARLVGQGLP